MKTYQAKDFLKDQAYLIFLEIKPDGRIAYANDYAVNIYGKDMVNQPLNDFLIDFSEKKTINEYLKTPYDSLINVATNDGIPDTYYFHFFEDKNSIVAIGQKKPSEFEGLREQLISLNNELNNLGRELQRKNAQLNKLNDLKNQFIGMAAHDLRSPLSIILMYSDFLLEETDNPHSEESREFIETIIHSTEFMLGMIDELLDYVKIESGKLSLQKSDVDLKKLLQKNIKLNRLIAGKKNINIHLELLEDCKPVSIDEAKFIQVLNNLVSNAIKFSPKKTSVTVSLFQDNSNFIISVKDEGPGIPQEDIPKLFKPFSKTSVQPSREEKSTGLGLSIAKQIIIGHQGRIWVESEVGVGSTFYVSIPYN